MAGRARGNLRDDKDTQIVQRSGAPDWWGKLKTDPLWKRIANRAGLLETRGDGPIFSFWRTYRAFLTRISFCSVLARLLL